MRILLDNALTHTPEGTSISVTAQRAGRDREPGRQRRRPRHRPHARRARLRPLLHGRPGRAAPGSGWRSRASWRCAWAASSGSSRARGRTEFTLRLPAADAGGARGLSRRRGARLAALLRRRGAGARGRAAAAPDDAGDRDHGRRPRARQRSPSSCPRTAALRPGGDLQERRPGVVTIRSIFSGGERRALLGGSGRGRAGVRLRDLRRTARSSPTPTWSPTPRAAAAARSTRRRRSTSSSPTATRSPRTSSASTRNADVALLKVDPAGLDLHPLAARRPTSDGPGRASRWRRSAARSARTSRCRSASSRRPTARSSR